MTQPRKLERFEKVPKNPLPVGYVPADSRPYEVKDDDDWGNVAARHNLDVQRLIKFNFRTNDPGEVNWYLGHRVGCVVKDARGWNWKFSSSADPGIIHIPTKTLNFDADEGDVIVGRRNTKSELAMEYAMPVDRLGRVGKALDVITIVEIGVGIFVASTAAGIVIFPTTVVAAAIAPTIAVASAHEAAINTTKKKLMQDGLSRGVVLAADRVDKHYLHIAKRFATKVSNHVYPERVNELQNTYNKAFLAGIAHGRQFSLVARENLFRTLWKSMPDHLQQRFSLFLTADKDHASDFVKWTDNFLIDYYTMMAAFFKRRHFGV